ncbi:MAG: DUF86 domain-containing protein [Acidobacteria bacterium]|nr:DUF86 domain-containing protein [Acidobacteriota bacterium]
MSRDEVYLRHILDAIQSIEQYVAEGRDAFMGDPMRQDAVMRRLEIIGEATKQLSQETTAKRLEIPWRRVAGLRDRLIHGYASVDLDTVWEVTVRDLPSLRDAVEALAIESDPP